MPDLNAISTVTTPVPPTPAVNEARIFDHMPKLGPYHEGDERASLLPKHGGLPGFHYLQVPCSLYKDAEDADWLQVDNTHTYAIVGPKGKIDCILMCQGKHLRGIAPSSIKNRCDVHRSIYEATGHPDPTAPPTEPKATPDPKTPQPKRGDTQA